jgi:hypothetical protein
MSGLLTGAVYSRILILKRVVPLSSIIISLLGSRVPVSPPLPAAKAADGHLAVPFNGLQAHAAYCAAIGDQLLRRHAVRAHSPRCSAETNAWLCDPSSRGPVPLCAVFYRYCSLLLSPARSNSPSPSLAQTKIIPARVTKPNCHQNRIFRRIKPGEKRNVQSMKTLRNKDLHCMDRN